nr:MAG TPA: hypothetical protein [Caudoviricetes sp.]
MFIQSFLYFASRYITHLNHLSIYLLAFFILFLNLIFN